MEKAKFPSKPFRTHGGANVPHHKNTSEKETRFLPIPPQVIIPMQMHIGAPATPCVAVGDHVYVGQKIGDSTSFVSAPIHASVSGQVKKITQIRLPNGSKCDAVVIDSDGLQEADPSIAPPVVNDAKGLLDALRASGAVGLGGAGFPTHVKMNFPPEKADTLIINGAECEPYITSDHREILENSWGIMSAIYALIDIIPFKRVIIGIEENKPDAIKLLNDIAENETNDPDDRVKVLKLKTRYPQGAEKMLIYACTKRVVPTGKLPLDAGCVVMNMTTLSFIANYLKTGMPLVSKRITVDGSAVGNNGNVIVPIGTPVSYVLDCCDAKDYRKVLSGGPMMGSALSDISVPVLKQNNAILAFKEDDADIPEETDCINCGRCVASCPMKLQPVKIVKAASRNDMPLLEKLNVMSCIECGCCTFNCPAKRHITQQMRLAKAALRESKQK